MQLLSMNLEGSQTLIICARGFPFSCTFVLSNVRPIFAQNLVLQVFPKIHFDRKGSDPGSGIWDQLVAFSRATKFNGKFV